MHASFGDLNSDVLDLILDCVRYELEERGQNIAGNFLRLGLTNSELARQNMPSSLTVNVRASIRTLSSPDLPHSRQQAVLQQRIGRDSEAKAFSHHFGPRSYMANQCAVVSTISIRCRLVLRARAIC